MKCPMKFLHIQCQGIPERMDCEKEKCAWWCSDKCAISQIASSLHYIDQVGLERINATLGEYLVFKTKYMEFKNAK